MAVYEKDGLLTYKDNEGNRYLLYPITRLECVDGAEDLVDQEALTAKQDKTDSLTAETDIADDDAIPFYDTSAEGHKKTLWSNVKALLGNVFAAKSHTHTASDIGVLTEDNLPMVPVSKGGLGVSNVPENNYIVGNGTDAVSFKTPSDVLSDIGLGTTAAAVATLGLYPVGSIYMSVVNTSPATLFGGTWEQIKDTFLLSAGDTYAAGSTGGEAEHTLTVNEMPSHRHQLATSVVSYNGSDTARYTGSTYTTDKVYTTYVGGSEAHNNMPPYLTVYVWQRTA